MRQLHTQLLQIFAADAESAAPDAATRRSDAQIDAARSDKRSVSIDLGALGLSREAVEQSFAEAQSAAGDNLATLRAELETRLRAAGATEAGLQALLAQFPEAEPSPMPASPPEPKAEYVQPKQPAKRSWLSRWLRGRAG